LILGVSRARVMQIVARALAKLRKGLARHGITAEEVRDILPKGEHHSLIRGLQFV